MIHIRESIGISRVGQLRHTRCNLNAMLNVQRVANIIKTIRSEGGLEIISKLSNGCDGAGGAHHIRTELAGFDTRLTDQLLKG